MNNDLLIDNLNAIGNEYNVQEIRGLADLLSKGQIEPETVRNTAKAWVTSTMEPAEKVPFAHVLSMMNFMETRTIWSRDELTEAFDKAVALSGAIFGDEPGTRHWKDKIVAVVDLDEVAVTAEAIAFFTATEARIVEVHGQPEKRALIADGYRAGPAGDH